MQEVRSVKDADVAGKRVLVRADFNVPLKDGAVINDLRIRAALPTLDLLHKNGASKIIIITHLGRPGGQEVEALKIAPAEARLRDLTDVPFEMQENLRFDPREEENDQGFARELALQGDVYVNEAFADSHRAHASIVGLPKLLPSYAGLRFVEEVSQLTSALKPPQGSLAIIGGAKFDTKEPLIRTLLTLYAEVLLGGALGNDLIKARGMPFGASLISNTPVPSDVAGNERLLMPQDAFLVEQGGTAERVAPIADIRAAESIIDIGPATAAAWSALVSKAPFVLWNGPVGVFERGYKDGSEALAQAIVKSGTRALIGGGDTAAVVERFKFSKEKVFVSTGGGAMLQFLTGGTLPGIEALRR